jgi:hypothetical protein
VKTLSIVVDDVGSQIGEFKGLPVFVAKAGILLLFKK